MGKWERRFQLPENVRPSPPDCLPEHHLVTALSRARLCFWGFQTSMGALLGGGCTASVAGGISVEQSIHALPEADLCAYSSDFRPAVWLTSTCVPWSTRRPAELSELSAPIHCVALMC